MPDPRPLPIDATHDEVPGGAGLGLLVTWLRLRTGEMGQWVSLSQYPKKTVTISGIAATNPDCLDAAPALRLVLEGTNDGAAAPDPAHVFPLHDDDLQVEIAHPGIWVVKENPLRLRPRVAQGEAVTVRCVATR